MKLIINTPASAHHKVAPMTIQDSFPYGIGMNIFNGSIINNIAVYVIDTDIIANNGIPIKINNTDNSKMNENRFKVAL